MRYTIISLAALAYQQHQLNTRLQQSIENGAARLDNVAAALARARNEALRRSDLTVLRQELGQRLSTNVERVEALEQRSLASGRVIPESMSSVAFLQGAYGFRERSTGRMLRHVVNNDGRPLSPEASRFSLWRATVPWQNFSSLESRPEASRFSLWRATVPWQNFSSLEPGSSSPKAACWSPTVTWRCPGKTTPAKRRPTRISSR